MAANDGPDIAQRLERRAKRIADIGMLLHQLEFDGRERALLQEHRIGNADLPDVVKIAATVQRLQVCLTDAERLPRATAWCARRSQWPFVVGSRASIVSASVMNAASAESSASSRCFMRASDADARPQLQRMDRLREEIRRLRLLCL